MIANISNGLCTRDLVLQLSCIDTVAITMLVACSISYLSYQHMLQSFVTSLF